MATILIVEDHQPVRSLLRQWLQTRFPNDRVLDAGCGEEGLALANRRPPDVVVVDIGLPGIDGLEVTRRLKSMCPEGRVVVLTAHEEERYRCEAAAAGADAYVSKRSMRNDLLRILCELHPMRAARPIGGANRARIGRPGR